MGPVAPGGGADGLAQLGAAGGAGAAGEQTQQQGDELPDLPASVQPVEKMIFEMADPAKIAFEVVRLAEADKFKGVLPARVVKSIKERIRESARDMGEI